MTLGNTLQDNKILNMRVRDLEQEVFRLRRAIHLMSMSSSSGRNADDVDLSSTTGNYVGPPAHKVVDEDTEEAIMDALDRPRSVEPPVFGPVEKTRFLNQFTLKQHAYIQGVVYGLGLKEYADVIGVSDNTARVYGRAVTLKTGETKRKDQARALKDIYEALDAKEYRDVVGIPKDWVTMAPDKRDVFTKAIMANRKS